MTRILRSVAPLILLLALPVGVSAQLHVLVGGGITTPLGDFSDQADPGYHAGVGLQFDLPAIPVGLRLDGSYHRLGAASSTYDDASALGGAVDVVFQLPGVGLVPYVLVGLGRYRVDGGPVETGERFTARAFQTGFGMNLGEIAFAELRWVRVRGAADGTGNTSFLPLTVGFRR